MLSVRLIAVSFVMAGIVTLMMPTDYEHDLFLSFHGEEVRSSFLSHLSSYLTDADVRVIVDEKLERGEKLTDGVTQAIQSSQLSLIIFSAEFAYSTRSLDKMVVAMKSHGFRRMVVPVFYKIQPSDVEFQNGTFKDAFIGYEDTFRCSSFKVQKWRKYLKEASNLAGWVSKDFRSEAELVKEIVKDIKNKLEREPTKFEYPLNLIVRFHTRAIEYMVATINGIRRFREEVAES